MKKLIYIIIGILLTTLYVIAEQHRRIQNEWGEWKELTLDGASPETPGTCVYCEYIKPLFESNKRPQKHNSVTNPAMQQMTMEELDRELDSLNKEGEYCLIRGADRELDTIIDHVHYIFIKEE